MERSDSRYRLREGQRSQNQTTQKTGSRACNERGADLEIVRSTRVLNDCLVVALVENLRGNRTKGSERQQRGRQLSVSWHLRD